MNVRPLRDRLLVRRVEEQEQRIGGIITEGPGKGAACRLLGLGSRPSSLSTRRATL